MTTFISLVAAISGLLVPAADAPPAAVPAIETVAAASAAGPASVDKRRYCVVETVTGSRIPSRQCQTRDGWARDGVDVDELVK